MARFLQTCNFRISLLHQANSNLGIDHTGHRIDDSGEWLQLCKEEDFIEQAVKFIASLDVAKLRELQGQARLFAEANLDWSPIVNRLSDLIITQASKHSDNSK